MAKTFLALLPLAEFSGDGVTPNGAIAANIKDEEKMEPPSELRRGLAADLHYNIQIHLPATKDIEVYNAIFKSIRDHLYEK